MTTSRKRDPGIVTISEEGLTVAPSRIARYLRLPVDSDNQEMMLECCASAINHFYDPGATVYLVGLDYARAWAMVEQIRVWISMMSERACTIQPVSSSSPDKLMGMRYRHGQGGDFLFVETDALANGSRSFISLIHDIAPEKY